jgi:hypothetical protein
LSRTTGNAAQEAVVTQSENDNSSQSDNNFAAQEAEKPKEDRLDTILLMDDQIETIENQTFYTEPEITNSEKEKLLELDLKESDVPTQSYFIDNVDENDLRKQQQSELIDKFIIANPRIEPAKDKNPYPVADLSASYLEENGGLVTETLARIYINQEYYSKAIAIYEKLCLKYPEKSSYFAAQIEKVKDYIKN